MFSNIIQLTNVFQEIKPIGVVLYSILLTLIVCTILSALGTSVFGNTPVLIVESINTRVHTNIVGK